MTLVVANMVDDHALFVADTKISWPSHGPNLPKKNMSAREIGRLQDGCLKNVVVSPDLCICWAGDLHFADRAFEAIWSGAVGLSQEAVLPHLLKCHLESKGQTDFILASRKGADAIVRIADGIARDVRDVAWIGSPSAFAKFSELVGSERSAIHANADRVEVFMFQLDDLKGKTCDPLLEKMTRAMRLISSDASLADVGDFVIPAAGTGTGFRYFFYMSFDANFAPPSTPNKWEKVGLGDVDTGAYNFQLIEYFDGVIRLPILHFLQARYALSFSDRSRGVPRIVVHGPESDLVAHIDLAARRRKEAMEQKRDGSE